MNVRPVLGNAKASQMSANGSFQTGSSLNEQLKFLAA